VVRRIGRREVERPPRLAAPRRLQPADAVAEPPDLAHLAPRHARHDMAVVDLDDRGAGRGDRGPVDHAADAVDLVHPRAVGGGGRRSEDEDRERRRQNGTAHGAASLLLADARVIRTSIFVVRN
jgi:hypothetical protein